MGALALGSVLGACTSSSTSGVVPSGWKSVAFEGLAISVPQSWIVATDSTKCPVGVRNLNVLFVDKSPDEVEEMCNLVHTPTENEVRIASYAGCAGCDDPNPHPPPVILQKVNGLTVNVEPDTDGMAWSIDYGQIGVDGSGPLVNQVMHTLRLQ